jgi:putative phosphoesterase
MKRIVVLSDTHMRRGSQRRLPARAVVELQQADLILHCGDVCDDGLLGELRHYAPLYAVLGNNDAPLHGVLPQTRIVDFDGVRIGMVHDSGRREGRARRMRQRFLDCDVVVFGHSHVPMNEAGEDGQWLMNPGSPTERRMQPQHTIGVLAVDDGAIVRHEIVVVDADSSQQGD